MAYVSVTVDEIKQRTLKTLSNLYEQVALPPRLQNKLLERRQFQPEIARAAIDMQLQFSGTANWGFNM